MKKRMIAVLLLLSMLLATLSGCGGRDIIMATAYLEMAQAYIDEGDYAAALETLKKGYEETGDKRIAVMMAELATDTVATDAASETEQTEETLATTAPTDPMPTTPTALTQPTEPEQQSVLNAENQRRINIFLSNFAEQRFLQYPASDPYYLLEFAYIHCQINSPGLISSEDYYDTIAKSDMDAILARFFNCSVIPSDNSMFFYHPQYSNEYIYYGAGAYEFMAASGEFRGYVAIAYDMVDNGDGTYNVLFNVYMSETDSMSAYYDMTMAQAEKARGLSFYQHGHATVKDYVKSDGEQTYQLIRYSVD